MKLRISIGMRIVHTLTALSLVAAFCFFIIYSISHKEFDLVMFICVFITSILGTLVLFLNRFYIIIHDGYLEYFSGLPFAKPIDIRAADVGKIERMSFIFGPWNIIRMKNPKEAYSVLTYSMEKSKEVEALLSQSLRVPAPK